MNYALRKAQEAMAAKRAAGEKIVVLDPIEKAKANPTSLRMAINAKCWDCVGAGCDPAPLHPGERLASVRAPTARCGTSVRTRNTWMRLETLTVVRRQAKQKR